MAYEARPGSLSLFKNDRKEKDSHPDYKGDGMDLEGNPVWISAWLKQGAKGKFMSISLQLKEPKAEGDFRGGSVDRRGPGPVAGSDRGSFAADLDDEIPF
jgi:hypothetical protein